jgi:L-ascorbate metabolism protein UlaG (beta-lactamase superfamily)
MFQYKNISITKYEHSSFRIDWEGESPKLNHMITEEEWAKRRKVIYIDPINIPDDQPIADLIFISHEHHDHCDPISIKKISDENTVIVGNKLVKKNLSFLQEESFQLIKPHGQFGIGGLIIFACPAYNLNKYHPSGRLYHPKENDGVGFILEFNIHDEKNNVSVYFMGDTDFDPAEMSPVDIDILMIPVSGTYVMTADEAIVAVNSIKPKIAIPMHYGSIVGSLEDAMKLKDNIKAQVEIL